MKLRETLPYSAHETWFAAFDRARTTAPRMAVVAELPRPLSNGWRPTVKAALTLATDAGQTAVADRLASRLATAPEPATLVDVQTCPGCGLAAPAAYFGVRNVMRTVRTDATGAPVLRASWALSGVVGPAVRTDETGAPVVVPGRLVVRIAVPQAQCRACRNTDGSEAERLAFWERAGMVTP